MAFGHVLTGLDVLQKIGASFANNLKPATPVIIKAAGVLPAAEWAAVDKVVAAAAAAKEKASAAAAAKAAPAAAAAAGGGKPAKAA